MIQRYTKLRVADNSGAKVVQCIGMYGASYRRYAYVGDVIKVAVKEVIPNSNVEKGDVLKAVVVRTTFPIRRKDGSMVRFDDNAVVIIDDYNAPKGSRIMGPIPVELREKGFSRIVSMAPEVV